MNDKKEPTIIISDFVNKPHENKRQMLEDLHLNSKINFERYMQIIKEIDLFCKKYGYIPKPYRNPETKEQIDSTKLYDWLQRSGYFQKKFKYAHITNENGQSLESILNAVIKKYSRSNNVKYEKQKKVATKKIALILAASASMTIAGMEISDFINKEKVLNDMPDFVTEETYSVNNHKNFAYRTNNIAAKIINDNSIYDKDTLIYNVYRDIQYDVNTQMDKIFKYMHMIINSNSTIFSDDIKFSCNYKTFNEYLNAKGFTDIKDYNNKMGNVVLAYADYNKADDKKEEALDNLEQTLEEYGLILDYDNKLYSNQDLEQILNENGITISSDEETRGR